MHSYPASDDVIVINDSAEIPGLGVLPVNSFLLKAAQPLLVDTGMPTSQQDFQEALWTHVDPEDLQWIYLTHPDRDHAGSLYDILDAAPQAKLITTFLGMGILSTEARITPDRVFLLNPGQSLDLGDRRITAFRPPVYDSPATTGFFENRGGSCFTSDCFGAPMADAASAGAEDVLDVPNSDLVAGQRLWATVDSPWVASVDRQKFHAAMEPLRTLDPSLVLSTHLPPGRGLVSEFLDNLSLVPGAAPFVGPDQAALEQLLAGFEPAGVQA
jgi:hypothetical protein